MNFKLFYNVRRLLLLKMLAVIMIYMYKVEANRANEKRLVIYLMA